MNRFASIVPSLLGSFFIGGSALADPLPQTQVSFTQGALNTWNADWAGVSGRTYFVQVSTDLVNWSFAPSVDFGSGLKSLGVDSGGVPKFFLRLEYYDDPAITSLQDAMNADPDEDGLSNLWEVSNGFNPFTFNSEAEFLQYLQNVSAASPTFELFTPLQ